MIKIIIPKNDYESIFALAAVLRHNGNRVISIMMAEPLEISEGPSFQTYFEGGERLIDATIANLEEENNDSENQGELISSIQNTIYNDLSGVDIFILNVTPQDTDNKLALFAFIEEQQSKIQLFLDSSNYWTEAEKKFLRKELSDETVLVGDKLTSLEHLEVFGYEVPVDWHEAARCLKQKDASNKLSARYTSALMAAQATDRNLKSENQNYYEIFVKSAAEIAYGYQDQIIDSLSLRFLEAYNSAEGFISNFKDDHEAFIGAKEIGRSVGILEIYDANPALNLMHLLEQGVLRFPWLAIIIVHFSQDDIQIIIGSQKLSDENLDVVNDPPKTEISEILFILGKTVISFQE